jgi:N-acetylmuramoyl-L-alanine amidase
MNRFPAILACLLVACLLLPSIPAHATRKNTRKEQNGATAHPAVLTGIKHWSNRDYTRVSVELDRDVTWEAHELGKGTRDKPGRIYIDIHHSRLGADVKNIAIGDGLLKGARVGQYKPDVVRVVLDTENIKDYKIFPLSEPSRLIIDVTGERRTEITSLEQTIAAPPEAPAAEARRDERPVTGKKPRVQRQKPSGKIRRIVLDPGHGGHDSGAIGPSGVLEKDVVLAIGLRLRDLLKDDLGLDIVMTRSTDIFIPLEERTAIANKVGADLFVSIHANAANNRSAAGIETYYLNLAKTEKAAQLAAKENGTSLEKVSVLQAILFDLMANYKLNDSAHLAEEVQKALHRKIRALHPDVKSLGVKQGPFYVLVGATMPSILVETAFVSNAQEESRLKDPDYQELTAEGIMEGILGYISGVK